MRIFLAGNSGSKKRETIWLKRIQRRLLSFYEMLDPRDQHYQKGALSMIKKGEQWERKIR